MGEFIDLTIDGAPASKRPPAVFPSIGLEKNTIAHIRSAAAGVERLVPGFPLLPRSPVCPNCGPGSRWSVEALISSINGKIHHRCGCGEVSRDRLGGINDD